MITVGWIGSILLSLCGLPQAIESFRKKHSNGITYGFIMMWLVGEIFQIIYVFHLKQWPIVLNAVLNLFIVLIILYYKIFPHDLQSQR